MRTTGRARRGTRATTACRWRRRVVPRDARHRGQRVLSRLSGREREHAVGLPAPPPLHLAGSRRGADGRPLSRSPSVVVCGWLAVWLLSDAGTAWLGAVAGLPSRCFQQASEPHPAVASTACSLKRPRPARVVDSSPSATPVETFAHAASRAHRSSHPVERTSTGLRHSLVRQELDDGTVPC
jgi:hypothetical protein